MQTLSSSPRQLSSRFTFFYKFIFPSLWSGGFGIGTLLLSLDESTLQPAPPPALKFVLLAIWVGGTVWMVWWLAPLKKVTLYGEGLTVSNFRREGDIPLDNIESVAGSVLVSPERISLRLRRPSVFGRRIIFMPTVRLAVPFTRHPVVDELRALISRR